MRRLITLFITLLASVAFSLAQTASHSSKPADKIVGIYGSEHEGEESKIKFFSYEDGYRAQVVWVQNIKDKSGAIRTDKKNPDPSKRGVPADKIVVIDKIKYNAKYNVWEGGEIYDPTTGKSWTVTCSFENDKKLKVRGSFGFLGKSVYWFKE